MHTYSDTQRDWKEIHPPKFTINFYYLLYVLKIFFLISYQSTLCFYNK